MRSRRRRTLYLKREIRFLFLFPLLLFGRTGQKTYGDRSMHEIGGRELNPYQVPCARVQRIARAFLCISVMTPFPSCAVVS